jgi:hypothetical protein
MSFKLQFKQEFMEEFRTDFFMFEEEFVKLEMENTCFPKGKRFIPFSASDCSNMLIWECEFDSMEKLITAVKMMKQSQKHEELYELQKKYIIKAYTNIYESFENYL